MVNSLNLKDDFYFEHKSNLFNKINYSKVNSLSRYYEKIIYATYIDNLNDLKKFENFKNLFNNKINLLILGPIPNVTNSNDPLKCFIKNLDCYLILK